MRTALRRMGNSTGFIVPKPMLSEIGAVAGEDFELTVENGRLVASPLRDPPRAGWAESAAALAGDGDDAPVWPEFANDDDTVLRW